MLVNIDNDKALELLIDRVKVWRDDPEVVGLFAKMYQNYIESGCFDESEYDVNIIVDNDIVNYCTTIESDEENFDKILELYKNGEYDTSCGDLGFSYIEAVSDDETLILVRY